MLPIGRLVSEHAQQSHSGGIVVEVQGVMEGFHSWELKLGSQLYIAI